MTNHDKKGNWVTNMYDACANICSRNSCMRWRYTCGNSTCSLIEFSSYQNTTLPKTTAGSIGDRCEELTRFQNRSCGQFFGNVGPVESFLSKHAAAFD